MPAISENLVRDCGNGNNITVPVTFDNCRLVIRKDIRFIQNGGTAMQFSAFKLKMLAALDRYFLAKYKMTMTPNGRDCVCPCKDVGIGVEIREVAVGGYPVTLMVGQSGGSSTGAAGATIQENDRPGMAAEAREPCHAHELGHLMLGLRDEYAGNNSGSPVFTDNSLMGNYHNEGYAAAEVKPRNLEFLRVWLQGKIPACCVLTVVKV
jgi:hypothetical protein